jgi:anti-anti-sigma factor
VQDEAISAFSLEILEHPDPFVVRLAGEIDIENADLVVALASHSWNGHGTVIFDVAELSFVGSTGIRAFLIVAGAADKFRCRNATSVVERMIRLTALDDWLEDP